MKVLVIDDNELNRQAASAMLKDHDLTVVGTYDEAEKLLTDQSEWTEHPNLIFDVVLTDLMMPASEKQQGLHGKQFVGQEMPLGAILALRALASGAKYVAIVTDTNHHDHPASAALDDFPRSTIGDVKVLCTNYDITLADTITFERLDYDFLQTDEGKRKYPIQPSHIHKGVARVKDWGEVLKKLTGN